MQVFGFDVGVCKKLVDFKESKTAVVLTSCEVKTLRKRE